MHINVIVILQPETAFYVTLNGSRNGSNSLQLTLFIHISCIYQIYAPPTPNTAYKLYIDCLANMSKRKFFVRTLWIEIWI